MPTFARLGRISGRKLAMQSRASPSLLISCRPRPSQSRLQCHLSAWIQMPAPLTTTPSSCTFSASFHRLHLSSLRPTCSSFPRSMQHLHLSRPRGPAHRQIFADNSSARLNRRRGLVQAPLHTSLHHRSLHEPSHPSRLARAPLQAALFQSSSACAHVSRRRLASQHKFAMQRSWRLGRANAPVSSQLCRNRSLNSCRSL